MIKHLSTLVDSFPGAPNQTRCFTHILNLVAKSVLHQFDVAKKSGPVDSEQLNDATKELVLLTQELDLGPDGADDDENDDDNDEGDEENDDDDDDGGDGENGMTEEELAELQTSLVPIRLMLTKVS
jgi:TATA-binding protein-associated factor Taf7